MSSFVLTSESVSEGHPDKVADYISDSVLDACLAIDPTAKVALETLVKEDLVVLAGEIKISNPPDYEQVARQAIREIGYDWPDEVFNADGVQVILKITGQSNEINASVVDKSHEDEQGAGDQGLMFGYASDESPELMPLPILLSHRLTRGLADDRKKGGDYRWIRPDSKSQVSVRYENGRPVSIERVVVSTQHVEGKSQDEIRAYVIEELAPRELGDLLPAADKFLVNPSGSFSHGGPSADAGVTGRKIIVDSYGGAARHGGGAFSGKDPSKVDRSAAYFGRYVAREVVKAGLAKRCEVQFSYAIGVAEPTSLLVDTFGTGDNTAAEEFIRKTFDMRPRGIIRTLNLLRPIYRQTTNYGHFGRPGLPWES